MSFLDDIDIPIDEENKKKLQEMLNTDMTVNLNSVFEKYSDQFVSWIGNCLNWSTVTSFNMHQALMSLEHFDDESKEILLELLITFYECMTKDLNRLLGALRMKRAN